MNFRLMLIVGLSLLSRSAAFAEPVAPPATRFPLMAWDYADDKATFEAMRDCGITSVAFVPIKALDLCHEANLQAIVFDERLSGARYHGPFDGDAVARNLPEILKEVGDHPAVLGYHLRDEPSPEQYPDLAKGVAAIRELAPGKWPYINLLPGDGPDYDKYVEDFVKICNPTVLSYDRYTTVEKDVFHPVFWTNLAVMREAGLLRDRRDAQWVHYSIPDDLDPAIRSIVEATLAAIAPTREAKRDAMRLSRTSRRERLRNGCVRPVVRG